MAGLAPPASEKDLITGTLYMLNGAPYMFLGFADYLSHERERPVAFVWRLRRAMPADFFKEAKVAAELA